MTSIRKPALRAAMIAGLVLVAWPISSALASAGKVTICHNPPGNPGKSITLSVGEPALSAHLAHGDTTGACANEDKDKDKGKTEQWTVCTPPEHSKNKTDDKDKSGNKGERRSTKVSREDVQKYVDAGATVGDCTSTTTVCDCTKPPVTATKAAEVAKIDDNIKKADDDIKKDDDDRAKDDEDLKKDDDDLAKLDADLSKASGSAKADLNKQKAEVQKRKSDHEAVKAGHDKNKADHEAVKTKHTKDKADKESEIKAAKDKESTGAYQGGSCSCPGGKTGSWVYILSPNKTSREIRGK